MLSIDLHSMDGTNYMRILKEGNFEKPGVAVQGEWTTFTLCCEKEDQCAIVLVSLKDGHKEKIIVPEEYSLGSVRSVAVRNLDTSAFVYYFEINGEKVLDSFAHGIMGRQVWNDLSREEHGFEIFDAFAEKRFDWKDDQKPEIGPGEMVMYKLHVRGFTMDAGLKTEPGTFKALMHRIPYLKNLGVTTVELMPVYEFEEMALPEEEKLPDYPHWETKEEDLILPKSPKPRSTKVNYWGYGPGNYFAVKASYAADPARASFEFKTLIRKFHENGMEVVMEMYFPEDTNHNLILYALRYWVREFHVDGFHLLGQRLPISTLVQDYMLSRTKIFYTDFAGEDCRCRKQRNLFIYREEYLYPARKILNHQNGNMRDFLDQQRKQGDYLGYVNFIAGNNGFTLADLFMYNDKHNEANGENNQDGSNWNFSSNCGVEGPTRKKYVSRERGQKFRNSVAMLFLAQGVPLLWAGDEMGNSQNGNNNAYCQDNPVGWLNWKNEKSHKKGIRFVQQMAAFRREHPIVAKPTPFHFADELGLGCPDVSYHGQNAWLVEPDSRRLCAGVMYSGAYSPDPDRKEDVYVAYNFQAAEVSLALPKLPKGRGWYLTVDTSDEENPFMEELKPCEDQRRLLVHPQAICILTGKPLPEKKKEFKKRESKKKDRLSNG